MSATMAGSAVASSNAKSSRTPNSTKFFYPAASLVLLGTVLWGFSQYWFHGGRGEGGREIPPPMKTLVLAHGSVMATWILLFVLQPMLVVGKKLKLHMLMGKIGSVVALGVVIIGSMVAIISARHTPPEVLIWGLPPAKFLAVPMSGVLTFAGLVVAAIIYRKKPAIHRAMMLCATLGVCAAAISRIALLSGLYTGTFLETAFGPFFFMSLLGMMFVIVRSVMIRELDKPLAMGVGIIIASAIGTMALIRTGVWDSISSLLM